MEITTYRWGTAERIEVDDDAAISFPQGIIGFDDQRRFVLIEDTESAVRWLQSLDDAAVAFAVLDAFLVDPAYEFDLAVPDAAALALAKAEDVAVFVILTIRVQPEELITANMVAPVVVNMRRKVGRQVILQDSRHSIQHVIRPEVAAAV